LQLKEYLDISNQPYTGLVVCPAITQQPPDIRAFCDADLAANPHERRSTSGASIYLGPSLVSRW